MTTPERSIEEIVEEFETDIVVLTNQHANKEMSDYEYTKRVGKLLTQTLQAERSKREEMVEMVERGIKIGREEIINKLDVKEDKDGNFYIDLDDKLRGYIEDLQ